MEKNTQSIFGAFIAISLILYITINTFANSLSLNFETASDLFLRLIGLTVILFIINFNSWISVLDNIHWIISLTWLCFWDALTYWATPFKDGYISNISSPEIAWYGLWYAKLGIAVAIVLAGEFIKNE